MKRIVRILALLLCVVALVALAATTTLRNQTGATASGIVIQFSEAVRITSYASDAFPTQSPASGEAESFTFSGGTLDAGGTFRVTWSPSSARVRSTKWIMAGSAAVAAASVPSVPTTYEEIMAQIAHYPGPDEPLYVPAEGEQIWLTDLDGHVDIYDNDSIKINYASGFDKNQITKVEVYRNGTKMRFLPEKLDVLTNEQMKTFDGNPAEHTPASSQTDHAINGYEYAFRFYKGNSSAADRVLVAVVRSAVQLEAKAIANIGNEFQRRMSVSDAAIVSALQQLREEGFTGIQFGVDYFLSSESSTTFFPQYTFDPAICRDWQITPTDEQVRRMIRRGKEAGLDVELRVELWVAAGGNRSELQPKSVGTWFENYTNLCLQFARLAAEEHVGTLCVGVELNSMERYAQEWGTLVGEVKKVFSGSVTFAEQTCALLLGWSNLAGARWDEKERNRFWDSFDLIEMNAWVLPLDVQADQRASVMLTRFVSLWEETVEYYRAVYPGKRLAFGEIGTYAHDGSGMGSSPPSDSAPLDFQEVSDTWYAYLLGSAALGVDEATVWCVDVNSTDTSLHPYVTLDRLSAIRLVDSIIGP